MGTFVYICRKEKIIEMINRFITKSIQQNLFKGKAIIIYGARQVGKTTLLKQLSDKIDQDILWINGDDLQTAADLQPSLNRLKFIIGKHKIVFIDEAQRIKNIGLIIKLIVDNLKDVQVVATGSSAFDLASEIKEPLTGRKFEYYLYPFSYQELADHYGNYEEFKKLEHRLIYGSYPEVVNNEGTERDVLQLLTSDYLYKDIFSLERLKKPDLIVKLTKALAFQVGSEVSYNELAGIVSADKKTVARYINLLEQAFIVFRVGSLWRNMRNELKFAKKIYFWDNGVRNALINNFNSLDFRDDIGKIWENYLVSERMKFLSYNKIYTNVYFWRTVQQQEIDWIEERDGKFYAYEFKWSEKRRGRRIKSFFEKYPVEFFATINRQNYYLFLSKEVPEE